MVLEKKKKKKKRYSGVNKGHEHGWWNICYLLKIIFDFRAKKKGNIKH